MRSLCTTFVFLLLAAPAAAQDSTERARQLFEAGAAALEQGRAEEAASYFDQSYRLLPRAPTACNMAVAQERLGRACEARDWYRQCAGLDQSGRFSDHATRQAAALDGRCQPAPPPHDPFVRTPPPVSTVSSPPPPPAALYTTAATHIAAPPSTTSAPGPDHGLLIGGIAALLIGGGAIGGGAAAALEAQALTATLELRAARGTDLVENTPEADLWYRAATFSDVALGLYVGGGFVAGLGVLLIIIDLAQPGVFGPSARRGEGPQLAFRPALGGGLGELGLRF